LGVGIGIVGGSPDDLEGVMAGLVPAIHVFQRIEWSCARQGESFLPAKLCCGLPHAGPVFDALPAWIAGTSPTMTTRAETNSKRYGSRLYLWERTNSCYTYPTRQTELFWGRQRAKREEREKAVVTFEARYDTGRNFVI
jgi:hypothetical protein